MPFCLLYHVLINLSTGYFAQILSIYRIFALLKVIFFAHISICIYFFFPRKNLPDIIPIPKMLVDKDNEQKYCVSRWTTKAYCRMVRRTTTTYSIYAIRFVLF